MAIRLSEACDKLNIGIHKAADIANKQGYHIEAAPDAWIDDALYGMLAEAIKPKEFAQRGYHAAEQMHEPAAPQKRHRSKPREGFYVPGAGGDPVHLNNDNNRAATAGKTDKEAISWKYKEKKEAVSASFEMEMRHLEEEWGRYNISFEEKIANIENAKKSELEDLDRKLANYQAVQQREIASLEEAHSKEEKNYQERRKIFEQEKQIFEQKERIFRGEEERFQRLCDEYQKRLDMLEHDAQAHESEMYDTVMAEYSLIRQNAEKDFEESQKKYEQQKDQMMIEHDATIKRLEADELEEMSRINKPQKPVEKTDCSVFVSYSRKDQRRVLAICKRLEDKGISCWIDKNGIETGDEFKKVIVRAIKNASVFLFFSSESSNQSEWTVKEVNYAVKKKKPIVPVLLDGADYEDSIDFDLAGMDHIDMSDEKLDSGSIERLITSIRHKLQA